MSEPGIPDFGDLPGILNTSRIFSFSAVSHVSSDERENRGPLACRACKRPPSLGGTMRWGHNVNRLFQQLPQVRSRTFWEQLPVNPDRADRAGVTTSTVSSHGYGDGVMEARRQRVRAWEPARAPRRARITGAGSRRCRTPNRNGTSLGDADPASPYRPAPPARWRPDLVVGAPHSAATVPTLWWHAAAPVANWVRSKRSSAVEA